jgi:HEPN domain-containing protein
MAGHRARGFEAAEFLAGAEAYPQELFYCQQAAEKALQGLLT